MKLQATTIARPATSTGIATRATGETTDRAILAILALTCAASGLIGVLSSHNWGGDFSMYIMQARNIASGVPQAQHGYVFAIETASYGPQLYPVGFPIFLSTFYVLFGNKIEAFIWAVSLQYAFLAGFLVYFYRDQLGSNASAFLCAFSFAYCPLLIAYKANVLPHIQYTILCLATLWILQSWRASRNGYLGIAAGVTMGLAISTRTVGVALIGALILYDAIQVVRKNYKLQHLVATLVVVFTAIAVWTLLRTVLFPTQGLDSYGALLTGTNWNEVLLKNIAYYLGGEIAHSMLDRSPFNLAIQVAYILFLLLCVAGAYLKVRTKGVTHIELFAATSIAILLVFPYRQGIPYLYSLLPLLPIYLWWTIVSSARKLPSGMRRLDKRALTGVLAAAIAVFYIGPLYWLHTNRHRVLEGPQMLESVEAFAVVSKLPDDVIVSFRKPRVLALYSDRRSIADPPFAHSQEIEVYLRKYGARHLLVDNRLTQHTLTSYLKDHGSLLWSNDRFSLHELGRN